MVVFDTATLLLLIDPNAAPPIDPATAKKLEHCKDRIENLVNELNDEKARILIPTPVLSEFLVCAGPNKQQYLDEFTSSYGFLVETFDQRAAVELAELEDAGRTIKKKKKKKTANVNVTKAHLRFDRQIIAIAKVHGASTLYTGDNNLASVAKANGLEVIMTWEIPLPPSKAQGHLDLRAPREG